MTKEKNELPNPCDPTDYYFAELLTPISQGTDIGETQILLAIEYIAKSKLKIKEQKVIDEIEDYRNSLNDHV